MITIYVILKKTMIRKIFFNDFHLNSEYYTDDQFVNNSKLENGLSIINFNTRSFNANFEKKIRIT